MSYQQSPAPAAQPYVECTTRERGVFGRAAYWISQIGSPPVLATGGIVLSVTVEPSPRGWLCAGSYLVLAVLIPCLYIMQLVRQGKVSDFHLPKRSERLRPLLLTLVLSLVGCVLLLGVRAPRLLQLVAATNLLQTLLFLVITCYWKISLHCAAAAGLSVLALYVAGSPAWPIAVGVPMIAWSRLQLKRHTFNQTLVGAALGAALFLCTVLLIR